MRKYIYLVLVVLVVFAVSCAEGKRPIKGETDYQRGLNAFFKDATTSPLKDKDRKQFNGLEFFKFDSSYVVNAKLTITPNQTPFKMKTSTKRLPMFQKYGEVKFELEEKYYTLNIYQNLENVEDEDYLFLPFLDDTNGETSYSGGRYIETRIPNDSILKIDFNEAFNPYCAYNEKYSCPIVPRVNYLPIAINAGVKAFDKH